MVLLDCRTTQSRGTMSQTMLIGPRQLSGLHARSTQLVADLVALLEVARHEFERDREAARTCITQAASILRSELQRHAVIVAPDIGQGELARWQVQRLRAYIDSHLSETIHVRHLSSVAKRSTVHFYRAFKRTFGQTPHVYVTSRRLHRARALLLDSKEPLSGIGLLCGFSDQAHFTKVFSRHTGETPGGWRRRHAHGAADAVIGRSRIQLAARDAARTDAVSTGARTDEIPRQPNQSLWR
jgi:AraC-like DNA-binding protein